METSAAERFIYGQLSGDATLTGLVSTRIYNTLRPEGSALPCVLFQLQPRGNDFVGLGAVRVWSELFYVVRGITEPEPFSYEGTTKTIADRIDALLHAGSGTNVGGTVWTCVRVAPFQMPETWQGRTYAHLGGIYRIQAR